MIRWTKFEGASDGLKCVSLVSAVRCRTRRSDTGQTGLHPFWLLM